ncbi:basic salivary proline-rich protein 2-like [Sus scrofa]|uniref:basic salivary proline-rich protein 2-like n=1 Tax=Sus scrofa TaxID=9823 RepID=UPI000A2B2B7D|nr:basic salivary proline-rich protein 2-like [Sus scrofa]
MFFIDCPHGGGNKANSIGGEKLTLSCPVVGNFSLQTRKALPLFPPSRPRDRPGAPQPRRPGTGSARTMTPGGRESSPARGAPGLTGGLTAAARTARPPVSGTRFFPPLEIETARARPRSPEHPASGGPARQVLPPQGLAPGAPRAGRGPGGRGARRGHRRERPQQLWRSIPARAEPPPSPAGSRPPPPPPPTPPRSEPATRRCPGRLRGRRALRRKPTRALGPQALGTPEATAVWSRSDPERGEAGPGRCAPRRPFPLPEAATPAAHPTQRPQARSPRVQPQRRLPSRSSVAAPPLLHARARQRAGRVRPGWSPPPEPLAFFSPLPRTCPRISSPPPPPAPPPGPPPRRSSRPRALASPPARPAGPSGLSAGQAVGRRRRRQRRRRRLKRRGALLYS